MRNSIAYTIAVGALAAAVAAPAAWSQYGDQSKDKATQNKDKTTAPTDKKTPEQDDVFDARKELQKARKAMEELTKIPEDGIPKAMLDNAAAIVIVPNVIKAGVVAGARHGDGVLIVRNTGASVNLSGAGSSSSASGTEDPSYAGKTSNPSDAGSTTGSQPGVSATTSGWSAPIFVELTGGSIGAQAGVQSTDVVLVFKNESAANKLLDGEFTLGADGSVAVGPVGREMSTGAKFDHEVYSYSRAKGVFAGVSLEGTQISIDQEDNAAFYGSSFTEAKTFARSPSGTYPADAQSFMSDFSRFVSGNYDKTKTDKDTDTGKSNTNKTQG